MTGDRRQETADGGPMTGEARYKFQRLKVYHLALQYVDRVFASRGGETRLILIKRYLRN
jgi:hypothetical protein